MPLCLPEAACLGCPEVLVDRRHRPALRVGQRTIDRSTQDGQGVGFFGYGRHIILSSSMSVAEIITGRGVLFSPSIFL